MNAPHEQLPFSERIPQFIVQFNGTQPEIPIAEQQEVAKIFGDFIDNTILGTIDFVANPPWPSKNPPDRVTLDLPYKSGSWRMTIQSFEFGNETAGLVRAHSIPSKFISIEYTDGDDQRRERFDYKLDRDGVVRRTDIGDELQDALESDITGDGLTDLGAQLEGMSTDERLVVLRNAMFTAGGVGEDDEHPEDAERRDGTNNQPIGLPELHGLMAMIASPNATPRHE